MEVKTNNNLKCTLALNALKDVYDPEIGLNVVDLGLVYEILFVEETMRVNCTMTLTTQFCPMGEEITNGVQNALETIFPDYKTELILTFDPAWSYELISEEGKEFLNG